LRVQEADAQAPPSGGVRACSRVSNGGDTGNDRLLIDDKTPVPIENSGHWKDGVIGSPSSQRARIGQAPTLLALVRLIWHVGGVSFEDRHVVSVADKHR
jgi:hypothetical protein